MSRTNNEKAEDAIYGALVELEEFEVDEEFRAIYSDISNDELQILFTILHSKFISLFRDMNMRLPTNKYTAHYWADQSRELITCIDVSLNTFYSVKGSKYEFNIENYYLDLFDKCRQFLSISGGS